MEQLQQHGTYWENQKTLPDTELTWLKNSRQYIIIGSRVRQIGQPIMSNTALNPLFPFTYLILGPPESGESHSRATVEPVPGTFPAKFQGLRKRGHLTAVFVVLDLPISATVWFDAACPFSLTSLVPLFPTSRSSMESCHSLFWFCLPCRGYFLDYDLSDQLTINSGDIHICLCISDHSHYNAPLRPYSAL